MEAITDTGGHRPKLTARQAELVGSGDPGPVSQGLRTGDRVRVVAQSGWRIISLSSSSLVKSPATYRCVSVTAAGSSSRPSSRARRQRNARREDDGLFDGYGLLAGSEVVRLRDGALAGWMVPELRAFRSRWTRSAGPG